MCKNVIIIGAGGHAKVIADIIVKLGDTLIGFLDDKIEKDTIIIDKYKVLGKVSDCEKLECRENYFVIAIGNNEIRRRISEKYKLQYYTAIHPSAIVGIDVKIGEGTVVMANAVINPSSRIGQHCIINTGAIVEHDNIIEDYVHISPNATLCGTVEVGKMTHIGAGATIKNDVNICDKCIIGAGAVVVKNIEEKGIYMGVPIK